MLLPPPVINSSEGGGGRQLRRISARGLSSNYIFYVGNLAADFLGGKALPMLTTIKKSNYLYVRTLINFKAIIIFLLFCIINKKMPLNVLLSLISSRIVSYLKILQQLVFYTTLGSSNEPLRYLNRQSYFNYLFKHVIFSMCMQNCKWNSRQEHEHELVQEKTTNMFLCTCTVQSRAVSL